MLEPLLEAEPQNGGGRGAGGKGGRMQGGKKGFHLFHFRSRYGELLRNIVMGSERWRGVRGRGDRRNALIPFFLEFGRSTGECE